MLTRRTLLKGAPLLLAQGETVLRVMQSRHFLPEYDRYFEELARRFGEQHRCKVEIDFLAPADLTTAIAADVAYRSGHDVFQLAGTGASAFDDSLADLTPLADRLARDFGGWIAKAESIGKVRGRWLAIPHWYISYPLIINRAYFPEYTDRTTWEDLLAAGARLKKAGHPFGLQVARTPEANENLYPLMLAYGATVFDRSGRVNFRRKEIAGVLELGKKLFDRTMTSDVLAWNDGSNNKFIVSGTGSMICNPITAIRTAAQENRDLRLEVVRTPLGPRGRRNGARPMSWRIFSFSPQQDLAREFVYAAIADFRSGFERSAGCNHPFLGRLNDEMPFEPKVLRDYPNEIVFSGDPGPVTPLSAAMYENFIVPTMFGDVVKGKAIPTAIDDAERALRAIK